MSAAIVAPSIVMILALVGVASTITKPSVAAVARFDAVSTMQAGLATDPVCYRQPLVIATDPVCY
jgi:hypothetical protein